VIKAMPVVRRLARDLGVDLSSIVGSGPDGSITRADVESASSGSTGGASSTSDIDLVPLTGVRKAIAAHMTESWTTIPHVTVQAEVRAEALVAARTSRDDRSLPVEALMAMAVMPLLSTFPEFNAVIRDEGVAYRRGVNLGFAVDTEAGLMVVVVRDAHDKSFAEIADEFERLAAAAIGKTAKPDELTGQTFTISNIGALGGGHGTPIIPIGTSAIVSIGRAIPRPVVEDGALAVGLVAPLDLSYDHRLIDGALGQRFLSALVTALEAR
jgi:pyruvate dehydrogenase E2 component (dihydrolipoamide acetyltransferase)